MTRQARSAAMLFLVLATTLLSSGCTFYNYTTAAYEGDLNTLRERGSEHFRRQPVDSDVDLTLFRLSAISFSSASPVEGLGTLIGDVYVLALPSSTPPFDDALQVLEVERPSSSPSPENVLATGSSDWSTLFDNFTSSESRSTYDQARAAAATVVDTGVDPGGILSWGRWTGSPTVSFGTSIIDCCDERRSLHYVFGATTPNSGIPSTGTATFRLVGATRPTAQDGLLAPGALDASSTVGVQWGGASPSTRIGFDMSGSIGAETFVLNTPGGATSPGSSPITYDPAQRSFGGDVNGGVVSGFFAGEDASHLGVSYSADVAEEFTVQGAAAFAR